MSKAKASKGAKRVKSAKPANEKKDAGIGFKVGGEGREGVYVMSPRFPSAHTVIDATLCATSIAEFIRWHKGTGEYDRHDKDGNYIPTPCPLSPEAWSDTLQDALVLLNDYEDMKSRVEKNAVVVDSIDRSLQESEKKLSLTVEQVMAAITIIKALLAIADAAAKLLPEKSKFRKAIQSAKDFIAKFKDSVRA